LYVALVFHAGPCRDDDDADRYVRPFHLAAQHTSAKVRANALDALQKLIAWGYLKGSSKSSSDPKRLLIDDVVDVISSSRSFPYAGVQLQVIKALLTAVSSNTCHVKGSSLMTAIGSIFQIFLETRTPENRQTALATLQQLIGIVFQRMEVWEQRRAAGLPPPTHASLMPPPEDSAPATKRVHEDAVAAAESAVDSAAVEVVVEDDLEGNPSHYHRDCLNVFTALCSISDKGFDGASVEEKGGVSVLGESKELALQLLSEILEHAGAAFSGSPVFLAAVKGQLSDTLIRNLLATQPGVVEWSLRIFLQLVKSEAFRPELGFEIEVFVEGVFLALLDSPNSSYDLRLALLQVIDALARDKSAIVELFANFDCVDGRQDVVEKVSDALAAIAQGRASAAFNATQRTVEQATVIRHQALSAILSMVHTVRLAVDASLAGEDEAEALEEDKAAMDAAADGESDDELDEDDPAKVVTTRKSLAGRYEEARRERALLQRAAVKFSMKPKLGLAFLKELGKIDDTPQSVAKCFHDLRDILDKTAIGEFLGGEKEFNIAVMHAYVEMIDFTGMAFEEAIRRYLSGFRIPGEAQKIDRMMEKFAERYCRQNPQSVFPDADTAFVLAYSIIMLNTDAHNPNIPPEKKMTKEGFIRNNRGVVNGGDFPREFLERVFDTIQNNPISLKEIDEARAREFAKAASSSAKAREEAMQAERRDILRRTERTLAERRKGAAAAAASSSAAVSEGGAPSPAPDSARRGEPSKGAEFLRWGPRPGSLDLLRSMTGTLWGPFMAAVSVSMESSDDGRVVGACLQGIRDFISAAGRLELSTERDAVVSTLAKFTHLGMPGPMRPKHVLACRALVDTAVEDGESLGSSWATALLCLSALARLHVEAKGAREDAAFFPDHSSRPSLGPMSGAGSSSQSSADSFHRLTPSQAAEAALVERKNAAMVQASIPEGRIERVYAMSAQLSDQAIVHMLTALCTVSMSELRLSAVGTGLVSGMGGGSGVAAAAVAGYHGAGPSSPRVFSLQKVVECADFNLDIRSRMTWSAIWNTLSQFFTLVGCHSNTALAMYAIDSLKQLSVKFLTKHELGSFHFQRMFLAPFAAIMDAQPRASLEVRDLIVSVFLLLVKSRYQRLRSGWSIVFAVHSSAARDSHETLIRFGFATVDWIVRFHASAVARSGAFGDMLHCLVAFASNPTAPQDISCRAVDLLVQVAALLARGRLPVGDDDDALVAEALEAATGFCPPELSRQSSEGIDSDSSLAGGIEDEAEAAEIVDKALMLAWEGVDVLEDASVDESLLVDLGREALLDARATLVPPSPPRDSITASLPPPSVPMAGGSPPRGIARRFTDKPSHTAAWWPLLTGLMRTVADPRFPVRTRALDALFALLQRFGPAFDAKFWDLVHSGVLLPIFDDVRHASARSSDPAAAPPATASPPRGSRGRSSRVSVGQAAADAAGHTRSRKTGVTNPVDMGEAADTLIAVVDDRERTASGTAMSVVSGSSGHGSSAGSLDHTWLRTTCKQALSALVRLHARSFRRLHPLLPNLLSLLEACATQEIEGLARMGVSCLRILIEDTGHRFNAEPWQLVIESVQRLFRSTRPVVLVDSRKYLLGGAGAFSDDEEEDDDAGEEHATAATAEAAPSVRAAPPMGASVLTLYGRAAMKRVREDGTWELVIAGGILNSPGGHSVIGEIVDGPAGPVLRPLPEIPAVRPSRTTSSADEKESHGPRPLPFNSVRVVTQCVVQVELIETLTVLTSRNLATALPLEQLSTLLDELDHAAKFARDFNADRPLRRALWQSGFMRYARHNKLPSLLRQETMATSCALEIVKDLLTKSGDMGVKEAVLSGPAVSAARDAALSRLRGLIEGMANRSSRISRGIAAAAAKPSTRDSPHVAESASRQLQREEEGYSPVVVVALGILGQLTDETFRSQLDWIFPVLCELVTCGTGDTREAVAQVLRRNVANLLSVSMESA
jgi:brefeldin A-inhibited guanine nucleotide-exchange protein